MVFYSMVILIIILYYNFYNILILLSLKKSSSTQKVMKEIKKGEKSQLQYLDYLLENYNIRKNTCKLYLIFEILGDLVFTSSLILVQEYPILQILIIFLIFATRPIVILLFAPIKMSNN